MFAGNFAPYGWAFCDGSTIAISDNTALYNLIGTTYGGNGQTTFNLPDLRGRVPIHQGTDQMGNTYVLGGIAGTENVTLNINQMPQHNHTFAASLNGATASTPSGNLTAQVDPPLIYRPIAPAEALAPQAVQNSGGSQPHTNVQPFLCVNFIICLYGVYPSQ
jgi:microcystin-dependent protein